MNGIILAVALSAVSLPALAGEGLMCSGDGVDVHIPMAAGVGINPLGVVIEANGAVWSSDKAKGTEIQVSQAFSGNHRIEIDFADAEYQQVVVQLRLFWTEEESDPVYGGTLKIAGTGVWAVSCDWG
jgi:hypothetical protein